MPGPRREPVVSSLNTQPAPAQTCNAWQACQVRRQTQATNRIPCSLPVFRPVTPVRTISRSIQYFSQQLTSSPSNTSAWKSSAEVIEQDAVSVKTFAVGTEYHGKIGREVQHLPEVRFATLQLLVQLFLLSHVHRSANDPLQNPVLDNRHTD